MTDTKNKRWMQPVWPFKRLVCQATEKDPKQGGPLMPLTRRAVGKDPNWVGGAGDEGRL